VRQTDRFAENRCSFSGPGKNKCWILLDVNNNNNNTNNNKLQVGRHPVAAVNLHITYARTLKSDYSRFSLGGVWEACMSKASYEREKPSSELAMGYKIFGIDCE
jgi:hypothetical protein